MELTAAKRHQPRLVVSHNVHQQVHGTGALARFNSALAVLITRNVGTMWTAYLFAALALVSLSAALASGDVIVIVSWIAQTFLQLVLLPIIIVGQNVIQAVSAYQAVARVLGENAPEKIEATVVDRVAYVQPDVLQKMGERVVAQRPN